MRAAVLVLICASAFANWCSRLPGRGRRARRVQSVSKPLTTSLVILLAATSGAPGGQVAIAVVALTLCLAGDIALMEPLDDFVLGLAAFLCGHVAFIVLFVRFGLDRRGLGIGAAAVGVIVAVTVGRPILLAARRARPALTGPVAAYLVVILTMAVVGWATGRPWVMVGSAAFVLSDSLLGWEAFVVAHHADAGPGPTGADEGGGGRGGVAVLLPVAVMVTYHLAIVSLALGL